MAKPDLRSPEAKRYRRLYNTARWRRIRDRQLREHPLCQRCEAKGFVVVATICNHDDPKSKLDDETFFAGPFSSACKDCHDSAIQSDERTGKTTDRTGYSRAVRADGTPSDPRHPWYAAAAEIALKDFARSLKREIKRGHETGALLRGAMAPEAKLK